MSMQERLNGIQQRVAAACQRSGRSAASIHILAVSKMQSDEAIEEAYAVGLRDFGENYVQELVRKREKFAHLEGIHWHMIGPLQRNKVKPVLEAADYFHALHSEALLHEFAKKSACRQSFLNNGGPLKTFIEVNIDQQGSKAGVSAEDIAPIFKAAQKVSSLSVQGLMCIPDPEGDVRSAFRNMALLRNAFQRQNDLRLELSMGMSSDFEIAIEEGADWIRLGTVIFGERVKHGT